MLKRNTKTKQLVLETLSSSAGALCHDDLEKLLSGKIDRVTIYRILHGFCEDGKVHKITGENGKTYYALCHHCTEGHHSDNHLHFHCKECETITCINEPVVLPTLSAGYRITDIACVISGWCPKCSGVVRTLCLFVVLYFTQFNAIAQYRGRVLDKNSDEAVAYASIYFPDYKTGTIADSSGVFYASYKSTSLLVQISCLGYKTFLGTLSSQDNTMVYLEPSYFEWPGVFVIGNSSKLQGENVSNVERLTLNRNFETQGLSLAEKLASVPGLSNLSTGVGIGKPVIRGLSGNRIAVFSQGIRVENQQWGDEHGLGLDENGYEQVEIIKGPASLLYGSDAMGGVLYFTGEQYAKQNSIEALIGSQYTTNTEGVRTTGAFKLSKERFHWNIFGGYTSHDDYKDGNSDAVANSRFHTGDVKTSLGYTADKFSSALKYNYFNEQYGLTEADAEPQSGRTPSFPYQNMTTHMISSENTLFFDNTSKLKINAGYILNNRREFEEATPTGDAALDMNLRTLSYDVKWHSPKLGERWALTLGSQGMYQTNTNSGEEMLIPDAATSDLGVFVMSDYYYTNHSYWQIGLRADGRHISGRQEGTAGEDGYFPEFSKTYSAFNFSTGVYQSLGKNLSLRANLASGYRSPNMFELLSDGVHEGTNRYEIGNPELKVENNYQADISLIYKSKRLELFINPYFNYIRNYIYLLPSGEIRDEMPVYNYAQTDAYLYGGEAGFHYHPQSLDWLHLEGAYSNTFGTDLKHNNLPLMPSQKLNATARASFKLSTTIEEFSVYLHEQYSFAQNRVAGYETTTGAYNLVNAGLGVELKLGKQKVLFNAAVSNIFNQVYYDHLSRYKSEGIYNMGRNVTLRLNLPLQFSLAGK